MSTFIKIYSATCVPRLYDFRLKHAWAAERNVATGDITTTVPGVADILRQILSETPLPAKPLSVQEGGAGIPRLIKGTGVIGRSNQPPRAEDPETPEDTPFIQTDTRINAVLVWDYEENLARYREIVAALDRPLELVEIRAAIVDVETDKTRELGFSWEYSGGNPRWENNAGVNVGDSASRPYIPVVGDGLQYATIFRHGLDAFMARINLLEKDGDANILSRPTVLTQDNIQAILEYTDTFYVRLQGQDEVDLADIKTGITLKVTPHVIQGESDSSGNAAGFEAKTAVNDPAAQGTGSEAAASGGGRKRSCLWTIIVLAVVIAAVVAYWDVADFPRTEADQSRNQSLSPRGGIRHRPVGRCRQGFRGGVRLSAASGAA